MANAKTRTATRPRPAHPKARTRNRKYRKPPWYRRGWAWAAAAVVAAVVAVVVWMPGDGGEEGGGEGDAGVEPVVGGDLHSLAIDPGSGRTYVGGHGGVAASGDGAETWTQIPSLDGADAMGWAFTDEAVLVGGHPGLFVSSDGGRTFEQRNEGLPATDIHGLGSDGTTIYAASPQIGILMSADQGESWEVVTDQAGQSIMGRILVDPEDPRHLVAPDMSGGATESTDGGKSWSVLGGMPGAMWVSWDPADTGHIIVTGSGAAAETTDGGQTWTPIEVPAGATTVEIDPTSPGTLYAGVLEGETAVVFRSTDGGGSWQET